MRTKLITLILFFAVAVSAIAAVGEVPTSIPGTGLTLVPPRGLVVAPAGATLFDETGETFINFIVSDPKFSLENEPTWRALFKHAPEQVKAGSVSGNLYRRTRAADGGAWDGWMFVIPRGRTMLTVLAIYSGRSSEAFERIKASLLTVKWNETIADPELALGVSLAPEGLHLVKGTVGALSYNESGSVGGKGVSLLIQSTPLPAAKVAFVFPAGCQQTVAAAFNGKSFEGPHFVEQKGFSYCEAWSTETEGESHYMALVHLQTGALLNVMGWSPASQFSTSLPVFKAAVANMKLHPGRDVRPLH